MATDVQIYTTTLHLELDLERIPVRSDFAGLHQWWETTSSRASLRVMSLRLASIFDLLITAGWAAEAAQERGEPTAEEHLQHIYYAQRTAESYDVLRVTYGSPFVITMASALAGSSALAWSLVRMYEAYLKRQSTKYFQRLVDEDLRLANARFTQQPFDIESPQGRVNAALNDTVATAARVLPAVTNVDVKD